MSTEYVARFDRPHIGLLGTDKAEGFESIVAAPSPFNFRLANTEFLKAGTPVTRVERLPNRTSLRRPGEFGTSAFQSSVYDPYQQSQSEPSAKAQLRRLQGDYTVVDSNRCVIELLEEHPRLFALLVEGVQPLKSAFGEIFLDLPTRCGTIQEKAFRERRSGAPITTSTTWL